MGHLCSLLIQKVVQSTELEVCAVYESGRFWVVRTRNSGYKISYSPWKMATGGGGVGREYGVRNMQLLGQQLEKEEREK